MVRLILLFFPHLQVRGLEFNSFTPNLLASGADDGEICIWDLSAPAEPSHFPPLRARSDLCYSINMPSYTSLWLFTTSKSFLFDFSVNIEW